MTTVRGIIDKYLRDNGYGGLVHPDSECGCEVGDIMPCEDQQGECAAGYKHIAPETVGYLSAGDWVITEEKQAPDEEAYERDSIYVSAIDWAEVATTYQGIIITPYQWSVRLEIMWYYGWDCASGCIWDSAAIASLEPVDCTEGLSQ